MNEFVRTWETGKKNMDQLPKCEYGIVLGGMISYNKDFDQVNFSPAIDRLMNALLLYKKGIINKIFISGGSGYLTNPNDRESVWLKDYLIHIGIPDSIIEIEKESRNTHENAIFSAKYFKDKMNQKFILITSAMHIRRSLSCFSKAGFKVIPFSVENFALPRRYDFTTCFLPQLDALRKWEMLLHEWLGYLSYKIAKYI